MHHQRKYKKITSGTMHALKTANALIHKTKTHLKLKYKGTS